MCVVCVFSWLATRSCTLLKSSKTFGSIFCWRSNFMYMSSPFKESTARFFSKAVETARPLQDESMLWRRLSSELMSAKQNHITQSSWDRQSMIFCSHSDKSAMPGKNSIKLELTDPWPAWMHREGFCIGERSTLTWSVTARDKAEKQCLPVSLSWDFRTRSFNLLWNMHYRKRAKHGNAGAAKLAGSFGSGKETRLLGYCC